MAKFRHLEDVEKMAAAHPESFFIPPLEDRLNRQPGDDVRLHFLLEDREPGEPGGERMWVQVTEALRADGTYKGLLKNQPGFADNIKAWDEVIFRPLHIARVELRPGDARWYDAMELVALVSRQCLEPGNCVRLMYRAKPLREDDSGWRMMSGQEPPADTGDLSGLQIVPVQYMYEIDNTLLLPLQEGGSVAFERLEKGSPWKRSAGRNSSFRTACERFLGYLFPARKSHG